jgi:hypothetical protein
VTLSYSPDGDPAPAIRLALATRGDRYDMALCTGLASDKVEQAGADSVGKKALEPKKCPPSGGRLSATAAGHAQGDEWRYSALFAAMSHLNDFSFSFEPSDLYRV